MTKRIYVGNLSDRTTERELTGLFERIGRVVSVRIMTDRETNRPKGFGFVEMDNEEADRAIAQLNQTDLNGRLLSVTEARARPQASPDGGAPASRLFVGNLPYDATATELKEFFSSAGLVSHVSLPVERESGKPRGFAFVEFPDPAHAQEAVRRFHNQSFKGRPLAVNEARARESRPPSSSSSFSPRPSQSQAGRPSSSPFSQDDQFSRKGGPSRHFGPDAPPQRGRKQPSRGPKSEHGRKKPMGERKGGQFFGSLDDEPYDTSNLDDWSMNQMNDPEIDEQP